MLALLTKITSNKIKCKWTKIKQDTFNRIKRIVACDTLLTYPDFNEAFKIHTYSSTFQLGAFIIQKGKTIAFYSIKLTGTKKMYTLTDKGLIIIVETLK